MFNPPAGKPFARRHSRCGNYFGCMYLPRSGMVVQMTDCMPLHVVRMWMDDGAPYELIDDDGIDLST